METEVTSTLLEAILNGGASAVIALLLIVIAYLFFENKKLKESKDQLLEKVEARQKEALDTIMRIQDTYVSKSEVITDKYHQAVITSNENSERLKEMLSRLVVLLSSNKK